MKLSEARFKKVNKLMAENDFNALIIPPGPQTTYVTDSVYSNCIVVIPRNSGLDQASIVLRDSQMRYKYVHSQKLFSPWIRYVKSGIQHIPKILKEFNCGRGAIGVVRLLEQSSLLVGFLRRELSEAKLVDATDAFEGLIMVKDAEEITRLTKGAEITYVTLMKLRSLMKPGVDEYHLLAQAGKFARARGADVGSLMVEGGNPLLFFASNPYLGILRKPIRGNVLPKGETIIVELCTPYKSYWTRLGMTISLGDLSPERTKILDSVRKTRDEAIDAMNLGVEISQIARLMNETLRREKLDKYVRYGFGGGIGLNLLERPNISTGERRILEENMVLNLRIGVYKPGKGIALIAENLLITSQGAIPLTKTSIPS